MDQLPLMESFYTLQGEGFHAGKPAYFIRLAGCDVGCVWCDVKESWDAKLYEEISVNEIAINASKFQGRLAVITGGEPLMYDLNSLTKALKKEHFKTNIETSGTYNLTGQWDWICFSPKKFKPALDEFYEKSNELKVIIFNRSDFDFAEQHAKKMHSSCELFLQPEWSKKEKLMPEIIEYIKENPKWRLSLQTHKYIELP